MRTKDQTKNIVAVVTADLHLSHTPPVARMTEPDWYQAMGRAMDQLAAVANLHKAPVLVAGDVFDHWKSPPELINFALAAFQKIDAKAYAIPGQHDLPFHELGAIHRSAFGVLAAAGAIIMPPVKRPVCFAHSDGTMDEPRPQLDIYGFPWGVEAREPLESRAKRWALKIALVHKFLWIKGCAYEGASQDSMLEDKVNPYPGYDVVVSGDNHQSFGVSWQRHRVNDTHLFNCGSLMRRKADQAAHNPRVGLVTADGSVETMFLDTQGDVLTAAIPKDEQLPLPGMANFMNELREIHGSDLDYVAAVQAFINTKPGMTPRVRKILIEALENDGD